MAKKVKLLGLNILLLKLACLWPRKNDNLFTRTVKDIFICLVPFPAFFGIISQTIREILGYRDNIHTLLKDFLASLMLLAMYSFILIFFKNRKKIISLESELHFLDNYFNSPDIKPTENRIYRLTKIIYSHNFISSFIYILLPLADIKNCEIERKKSVYMQHWPCGIHTPVWYPFDIKEKPFYDIIIVCLLSSAILFGLVAIGIFTFQFAMVIHITRHLKNLKMNIVDAVNLKNNEKFVSCIKYHIDINKLVNNFNQSYSYISLVLVSTVSLIVGILEFEIIVEESFFARFCYFLNLLGYVVTLFVLCYTSQILHDQSVQLADDLYNTDWINCSITLQKDIRFVLQRFQHPLSLSIGPIGNFGLETYLSMLKSAYSFFAVFVNLKQ